MLIGRSLRKRWADLTPGERAKMIRRYGGPSPRVRAGTVFGLAAVGTGGYVALNQDETPLTHRSRFLTMNMEEARQMSQGHYQSLLKVPNNGPPPTPCPKDQPAHMCGVYGGTGV